MILVFFLYITFMLKCLAVVDPPALCFNDYEGDPPQETPKEEDKSEDISKAADKLLRCGLRNSVYYDVLKTLA